MNLSKKKKKSNKIKSIIKSENIICKNLEKKLYPSLNKDKLLDKIGQGTYGMAFKGCLKHDCRKYAMSVKYVLKKKIYNNYIHKNQLDLTHPAEAEYVMGQVLSDLVFRKITPHINIIYEGLNCTYNQLKNSESLKEKIKHSEISWLNNTADLLDKDIIFNDIKITFHELADTDLKSFILDPSNKLSFLDHIHIFFQFCYTLACAQYHIPGFRHNDVKPDNILVKKNMNFKSGMKKYKIVDKNFYIPNTYYTIKLYDYDFCNSYTIKNQKIINADKNKKSPLRKVGLSLKDNPIYDLHLYINFYLKEFNDILSNKVKKFFYDLIPEINGTKLIGKGDYNNPYLYNYKLTNYKVTGNRKINFIPPSMKSPIELLISNFFEEYITTSKKKKVRVIMTYDSKIKKNEHLFKKKYMFNI